MARGERFSPETRRWMERLFPEGLPALWCPPLTHYAGAGVLDAPRMRAHLASMLPWVRGLLVPGSTGEAWEMSAAEVRELLAFFVEEIRGRGVHLLVGALHAEAADAVRQIHETVAWLRRVTGADDAAEALVRASVCGFAVCAPRGAGLGQERIRAALDEVLSIGVPIALYQLPQVTQNEIAPETAAALSARHPNFYLFKDSSGADRVAASGFRGAFLVRGAEGDYARQLAERGGPYDGYLLSTANCFGRQLAAMIEQIRRGETGAPDAFSRELSAICAELLGPAGAVGYGNAFANTNKALDHYFAHGPEAAGRVEPPLLHSGRRLPRDVVDLAGASLRRHGLMPARGYL